MQGSRLTNQLFCHSRLPISSSSFKKTLGVVKGIDKGEVKRRQVLLDGAEDPIGIKKENLEKVAVNSKPAVQDKRKPAPKSNKAEADGGVPPQDN